MIGWKIHDESLEVFNGERSVTLPIKDAKLMASVILVDDIGDIFNLGISSESECLVYRSDDFANEDMPDKPLTPHCR